MIRLLKNKEVRFTLFIQLLVALPACAVCFYLNLRTGLIAAVLSSVLILIYYIGTWRRYRKIAALAADIDKLLHKDQPISMKEYAEGELAILHSEIYKMTVRLREQRHRLLQDKTYLADSLANISHQIRTPLTSINLLVQLLSAPDVSQDKRVSMTRELCNLLARIDWLITTLLKISKLDAGTVQFKREMLSLEELVQRACEPLLVPIELRGQELSVCASGQFAGDVSWTCEAVTNIVKNCMEHTPDGGKIRIDTCENPLYAEIIIRDTGTGIDRDDLPHIFERFYKGKNADGNSFGIGLALSRMIVTAQDGTIKAENQISGGAMFTLRFYKGIV